MIELASRLKTVEEYYFSKKLTEVSALISEGKPIINMGVGSPDLQAPQAVISAIKDSLNDPELSKYQSYRGLSELREAIAHFYLNSYGVNLNPKDEILPMMGSKISVIIISLAFLNRDDGVLIPNPGYPTYHSVTKLIGGEPVFYNLEEQNGWQPDFKSLEKKDLSKIKLMWVNYPHMPTGAVASASTFKKMIDFGKKHKILIVNDNPYSFILNKNPQSILQIQGAKDVALELNSLSKSFNMAGWRVGMVLGKPDFINAILTVKTQMESGMFYGIQKGAILALQQPNQWFTYLNAIYKNRRLLIWQLAEKLNCTFSKNSVGMFVWAKLPKGKSSTEVVDRLLYKKNIFVAPGDIFGEKGSGYLRFSLCVPTDKIKQAIQRIN